MIPVASKQQSMKLLATTVTKKLDHYMGKRCIIVMMHLEI